MGAIHHPELEALLMSTSIEEHAMFFRQKRFSRHFHSLEVERAYRVHHFHSLVHRMRFVVVSFFIFVVMCTSAVYYQWRWFPMYKFINPMDLPIAKESYNPLIIVGVQAIVLNSRLLSPHTYQRVVTLAVISFISVFSAVGGALDTTDKWPSPPVLPDVPDIQEAASTVACQAIGLNLLQIGSACTLGLEPPALSISMLINAWLLRSRAQARRSPPEPPPHSHVLRLARGGLGSAACLS